MAREDILARIEAAKLAKVDAEREQANAAAAAILKQKHMASLHDRVRKALIISDENLKIISAKALSRRDELLISQQEQLNAQAGDDESLFKEAVDAGVDMSNEEKHEVVQEGRREIKGNTKEEIKNAHAEWKGASRDAKLVSEVSQAFDSMSDEEKTALDTAMESGDLDAVIKVADAYKTRNRESLISNIDSEISAKNTDKVKTEVVEELTPEEASMSTRERLKAEGVRLNIELQAQLADPEDGAKTERSIEETSEKMKDLNIKIVALQESGAMLTPEMLEALTSELAQLKNDQKLNYAKQKSRSIKEPIEWTTSPLTGNYLTYKSKDKSYPLFDGSRGTEADKKLSELTEFFGEVYNQVRKINTNQIQLPDSEHKALFSQSFDLNGLQQGLNNLNTKGQNYIKARKEMGASHEELKNDPEVIKLRKQIGVLKELVATKAESYKQEHARLEENAPKNEGEFLSRVKSVEDGFSELNNSYRGDLREIRSNYQTYLKDLKKQHPEFDVRNNPEYAALYQSSSGRSELKLEAISHKTNDDFAEFALAEIQKDPKMVAFMKDAAKKINQYGVASMELNQQKLDLRALFLPRKDWMKDTETAENMWKQLYRSNASDTLDTSFLDTNIARKFGLADLQGFEPVRVSSLPEVIDKKSSLMKEKIVLLTENSSMEDFAREKDEITKGLDALRSRVATELQPAESALTAAENNRPKRESRESVIPPFRTRDYINNLTIELNNANSEEVATIDTREKKIQSDYYQNRGLEIFEDDKKNPEFMKALDEYRKVFNDLAPAYQNLLKRANTYNKEMHARVNKTGEKTPSDVWLEKTGIGLTNPWRFPGGVDEGVKNRYKMHGISDALEI